MKVKDCKKGNDKLSANTLCVGRVMMMNTGYDMTHPLIDCSLLN